MKNHLILWSLFVGTWNLLCIPFAMALPMQNDPSACAKALGLSHQLEAVLAQRQLVVQNPNEENYKQFLKVYRHYHRDVAYRTQTTPLHEATNNDDIPKINDLVTHQGFDINTRGLYGDTPVSFAPVEITRHLLSLGADANAVNPLGQTSLHYHALDGSFPGNIDVLLDHGADIEARDLHGMTPIIFTFAKGNVEVFHALRSRGASLHVNTVAAPNALLAVYIHALSGDYRIDANPHGPGILSITQDTNDSYKEARITMARLVLEEEPSFLHTVDHIHRASPLHWASFYGDTESIRLFLDRGASLTRLNGEGETALHVAARSNQVRAFFMLRSENPRLMTFTDNNGRNPIESARHADAKDILTLLGM